MVIYVVSIHWPFQPFRHHNLFECKVGDSAISANWITAVPTERICISDLSASRCNLLQEMTKKPIKPDQTDAFCICCAARTSETPVKSQIRWFPWRAHASAGTGPALNWFVSRLKFSMKSEYVACELSPPVSHLLKWERWGFSFTTSRKGAAWVQP